MLSYFFSLGSEYQSASKPGTNSAYSAIVATSPVNIDRTCVKKFFYMILCFYILKINTNPIMSCRAKKQ